MTLLNRLDPRTKFLAFLLVGVQVLLVGTPLSTLAGSVTVLAGVLSARLHLPMLLRRAVSTLWFGLVIVTVHALTVGGTVLAAVGPGYVSAEGLLSGLWLYCRLLIILGASVLFSATTPLPALVEGVERGLARLPRGLVPAGTAFTAALNLGPLMVHTAQRLKMAILARGMLSPDGPLPRLRAVTRAIVPFFVGAFRTADNLALAMEARCYIPGARRTALRSYRMTQQDIALLAILTLITLMLIVTA